MGESTNVKKNVVKRLSIPDSFVWAIKKSIISFHSRKNASRIGHLLLYISFFTSVHPRITCVTLVHTCFKLGIRAICLLILLASSSLTSSGISTTGPRLLEQHLLSQLARGVLNWVEPMISRQQCSPSNRSCKTNRY